MSLVRLASTLALFLSRSIIHTDLKPENVLLDLPPRPPPDSEQPPPLQGRQRKAGAAVKGVAATIEELNTALALADEHGLSAEEKRKLKKKVCDRPHVEPQLVVGCAAIHGSHATEALAKKWRSSSSECYCKRGWVQRVKLPRYHSFACACLEVMHKPSGICLCVCLTTHASLVFPVVLFPLP